MGDTIAAIASGHQVAAIGIVRMSGEQSISYAESLFVPSFGGKLSEQKDRKLVFGELRDTEGQLLDLCLCTISRAPGSYTGEDTVEFQCHGSPMLLRTLLDNLFRLGARQAGPGEFTKRAFLNGRMDLSSAEAVIDLIDAETEEAVRNAAGQLSGAIHRKAESIYPMLADVSQRELRTLLKSFDHGQIMSSGIPTAIIGLPNAGKSSLLNALVGYERAIVTEVPGTTRDTVEERVRLGGVTLRLIDTAGIRETEDRVEKLGVERSISAAENAALILAVIDGSREAEEGTRRILQTAERSEHAVAVISKADLPQRMEKLETRLPQLHLSSLNGEGMEQLEKMITAMFPAPSVPAGEILTNARQAEAVRRACESMEAALCAMEEGNTPDIVLTETETAMQALGELTGSSVREDITNRIFSRFCVGK